MNPGDAEQNEGRAARELLMQRAAEQAVQEIVAKLQAVDASDVPPQEKAQQKSEIAAQTLREYKQAQEALERLTRMAPGIPDDSHEAVMETIRDEQKNLRQALIKVTTLADKDVKVSESAEKQMILRELAKTPPSESEAVAIQASIGDYLLGDDTKQIIISTGEQKSDFQKGMDSLRQISPEAYHKLEDVLVRRSTDFGLQEDQMREVLSAPTEPHEDPNNPFNQKDVSDREAQFIHHDKPLYSRFTKEDQEFLQQFYEVKSFKKNVVDKTIERIRENDIDHIKHRIDQAIKDTKKDDLSPNKYNDLVEKQIKIEASEEIAKKLVDIMNKLYWRVHIDRPHKFFEEIEKEDFMTGIEATRMKIMNALENLQHSLEDDEKQAKLKGDNVELSMYKHGEKAYTIDEKKFDKGSGGNVQKPYMRTSPLPEFKPIALSEYVQSLISNLGHWRHRSEYLHNARAIFNHPAHGDKGFFANLGGYAENLSGTDVDEMMLLPDGPMVYDAFVLYDKLVEEEFASQDWKHRPNQFTNSLEEVNTKVEKEVIDRLHKLYDAESIDAIRHAVNSAVGMARGVFLTETEKSAYADAVDPKGGGMFASYATNDATALQTFNPLHVMMRWQGEHMLPMFYFMNVKGSGSVWDHSKNWKRGEEYFKAFVEGKAAMKGEKYFIDDLVDNLNVGGMMKRKGWRMNYSLEGHMVYEPAMGPDGKKIESPDGKIVSTEKVNHLETFKAMDAIGYEAIYDFLTTKLEKGILKASSGKDLAKKDDLFKYIFERYFVPLGETDYKGYLKQLRKKGEEKAYEQLKKGSLSSWHGGKSETFEEEINYQTGMLFIKNTIAREVAVRFPSKFLRIDRDRYTDNGVSRYSLVQRELGMSRDHFNEVMRDYSFAEMLLRREMTETIKNAYLMFPEKGLNDVTSFKYKLNKESITRLLKSKGKVDDARIQEVVKVWEKMKEHYLNSKYLDSEGFKAIDGYKFTFGIEDTDFTLMAMRSTGPRMIARSIGDVGQMESITPWIIGMPRLLNQIATNGKKDFTPIIEYLQKAQSVITQVHAPGSDYQYIYKIASAAIQYFKKDTAAKPLLGLFRIGKRNSMAAEYAGRSTAVWEWDARDIDRFITSMESLRLLPKSAFNAQKGPKYEDRWINLFGKPVKFGKKQIIDFEYNGSKMRKEFGATYTDMAIETVSQYLPIVLAMILWKYIEDAMKEAEGKKK